MFPTSEKSSQTIKVTLAGDTRRLTLALAAGKSAGAAFDSVQSAVRESFHLSQTTCLLLKYKDDEGDLCTLTEASMADLAELAAGSVWRLEASLGASPAPELEREPEPAASTAGTGLPLAASPEVDPVSPAPIAPPESTGRGCVGQEKEHDSEGLGFGSAMDGGIGGLPALAGLAGLLGGQHCGHPFGSGHIGTPPMMGALAGLQGLLAQKGLGKGGSGTGFQPQAPSAQAEATPTEASTEAQTPGAASLPSGTFGGGHTGTHPMIDAFAGMKGLFAQKGLGKGLQGLLAQKGLGKGGYGTGFQPPARSAQAQAASTETAADQAQTPEAASPPSGRSGPKEATQSEEHDWSKGSEEGLAGLVGLAEQFLGGLPGGQGGGPVEGAPAGTPPWMGALAGFKGMLAQKGLGKGGCGMGFEPQAASAQAPTAAPTEAAAAQTPGAASPPSGAPDPAEATQSEGQDFSRGIEEGLAGLAGLAEQFLGGHPGGQGGGPVEGGPGGNPPWMGALAGFKGMLAQKGLGKGGRGQGFGGQGDGTAEGGAGGTPPWMGALASMKGLFAQKGQGKGKGGHGQGFGNGQGFGPPTASAQAAPREPAAAPTPTTVPSPCDAPSPAEAPKAAPVPAPEGGRGSESPPPAAPAAAAAVAAAVAAASAQVSNTEDAEEAEEFSQKVASLRDMGLVSDAAVARELLHAQGGSVEKVAALLTS